MYNKISANLKPATPMGLAGLLSLLLGASFISRAAGQVASWQPDPTQQQDYKLLRSSSSDPNGANVDSRPLEPGETLTVLNTDGPGQISHIWFTFTSTEPYSLKKIVLRMYWDGESTPSVEAPIGDFFGLGLGRSFAWQSEMLSVGNAQALYNIDYRRYDHPLPKGILYFHAEYRQAQPNHGWTDQWVTNEDPLVKNKPNLDGKNNYVWMDAVGRGQFVGVTMSVLQNQDAWWGEGDDMFFVDGATKPSIAGTGAEDYFLGAWGFGGKPFSYQLYGAPVVGNPVAGSESSVYRFHLDSPIPFEKSFKATIEDGNANHRSDNFYSVAYWYQTEPHAPFPPLPTVEQRIPALQMVGGPGNDTLPTQPPKTGLPQ